MSSRFESLVEALALRIHDDYTEARAYAQSQDPQRAGHEGESTWQRVLADWGPGWPVVTRKYVVGPGGDSNEVDLLLLKPDYPEHLRDQASILYSGVAAAFSVKLTARRPHIAEAIQQKKRLLSVVGDAGPSPQKILRGVVPFGLLAHSSDIANPPRGATEQTTGMVDVYYDVAHSQPAPLVTHPSEELDALIIADRCYCSATRTTLLPTIPPWDGPLETWTPASSFSEHYQDAPLPGTPLAGFITWLHELVAGSGTSRDDSALHALGQIFGTAQAVGRLQHWPREIYPDRILSNARQVLLDESGGPMIV